jgi:ABC-type glutathione transport system ATPase component
VTAVDGVTFELDERRTLGLVGESGSGKSTIGRAILGLVPAALGTIAFDGEDITRATSARRRELSAELQVVFQDPFSSLNPSRTIGWSLAEPLRVHRRAADPEGEVAAMLERVGLRPDAATRYPAQFSGGQRQRVAIARALMVRPRLVICDEAVSALDLSVQAQVLNLLQDLQEELGMSYLFISHDLDVVRHVADEVVVLRQGRIVETGRTDEVYASPKARYTAELLAAAPVPDPDEQAARRLARLQKSSV